MHSSQENSSMSNNGDTMQHNENPIDIRSLQTLIAFEGSYFVTFSTKGATQRKVIMVRHGATVVQSIIKYLTFKCEIGMPRKWTFGYTDGLFMYQLAEI